jgi:hypothetical protein
MYKQLGAFAFACLLVVGCRDNGPDPLTPLDLSMGNTGGGTGGEGGSGGDGGSGGNGGSGGGDMAMGTKTSTIKAMRMAGKYGSFQLENVVAFARTPSTNAPRLFVQDAGGGDFASIVVQCSASSTSHKCLLNKQVAAIPIGNSVTITGTYFKNSTSGNEDFYLQAFTDNGVASTAPEAPLVLTVEQIARSANNPATTFRKATVTPSEDLVMYDWSPADMKFSGAWGGCTQAPYTFGFAMAKKSDALTAGPKCTVKTSQPTPQPTTPKEILIGTDFYYDFQVSSDCQCAGARADKGVTVPDTGTTWPANATVNGIIGFSGGTTADSGYQYFSPTEKGPLTGTVAGPQ